MRKKKEIGKQKIVQAAITEFKKCGYNSASMRDIASLADMTVGNIYCYYKGKEALFNSLVSETFDKIKELVNEVAALLTLGKELDQPEWRENFAKTSAVIKEYRERIIILFDGSRGTKFENALNEFLEIIIMHTTTIIENYEKETHKEFADNKETKKFMIQLLANSLLSGFIQIVKKYRNESWTQRSLHDLFKLHIFGVDGFFNGK